MQKEFYFSTKALLTKENQFLALYKEVNGQKVWDLPGGLMEFGESAQETLQRELLETLGIEVVPVKLIDTWNDVKDNLQTTGIIYHCITEDEVMVLSEAYDGMSWVDMDRYSEFIKSPIFLERMHGWDWEAIADISDKLVYPVVVLDIKRLVPNNLYLSKEKIDHIEAAYMLHEENSLPPVVVVLVHGEYALIDGHARAWVANQKGHKTIKAIVISRESVKKTGLMYGTIHRMAKSEHFVSIQDLKDRILTSEQYREWYLEKYKELQDITPEMEEEVDKEIKQ